MIAHPSWRYERWQYNNFRMTLPCVNMIARFIVLSNWAESNKFDKNYKALIVIELLYHKYWWWPSGYNSKYIFNIYFYDCIVIINILPWSSFNIPDPNYKSNRNHFDFELFAFSNFLIAKKSWIFLIFWILGHFLFFKKIN